MRQDKLRKVNVRFFIIPLLLLSLLSAVLTLNDIYQRVRKDYQRLERSTQTIADSYVSYIERSREAYQLIESLLDEKLLVASESILLMDLDRIDDNLIEIAQRLHVDQINLYNRDGIITHSNVEEYVGWVAYEGHPVYDFLSSGVNQLTEDIRMDTESGIFYKYGYVRNEANQFVQIGVLAEDVVSFLDRFDVTSLIEELADNDDIEVMFLTNQHMELIASSDKERFYGVITDDQWIHHISQRNGRIRFEEINGTFVLHACTPVFFHGETLATLTIVWSRELLIQGVVENLISGFIALTITMLTMGIMLYFAYRKSQKNVEIAYYDRITGLPNREYFHEYLLELIKKSDVSPSWILLINSTNFKLLNTTHGFAYGDKVLVQIANRLKQTLPTSIMLFRLNADRFLAVVEDKISREELEDMAHQIVRSFEQPFTMTSQHDSLDSEVAIVPISSSKDTVDHLIHTASLTMAQLKFLQNQRVIFYDETVESMLVREDKIERILRSVIKEGKSDALYLVYQPQLDVKSQKIIGLEALARLQSVELGQVSPMEFIRVAESRMLIYDLGLRIIENASDFATMIYPMSTVPIRVAINISVKQLLRDEFISDIAKIIEDKQIKHGMLEFEITESAVIDNFELINTKLGELQSLGILISMDDFGTGYSSFARLRELNVDIVKIDRFFIEKIDHFKPNQLISADIISMLHKLNKIVVAEGVETQTQYNYLVQSNCDTIQGYHYSKPLPQNLALSFIENALKEVLK